MCSGRKHSAQSPDRCVEITVVEIAIQIDDISLQIAGVPVEALACRIIHKAVMFLEREFTLTSVFSDMISTAFQVVWNIDVFLDG